MTDITVLCISFVCNHILHNSAV